MQRISRISIMIAVLFSLVGLSLTTENATAQIIDKSIPEILKKADRSEFRHIPKKPGLYTKEDWQAIIDSTWGTGMSTSKKLQLFDYCWNLIDQKYPSFFHIEDNWDSLRAVYRPEIASGVSRGRFSAIMNHLFASLTDLHTVICDVPVSRDSLYPGTPLLVTANTNSTMLEIHHLSEYCHFGASLAPLPDSTAFVYDVIPDHPLGLEPGDIILGYDGIAWKKLYKDLLDAELPLYGGGTYGSNPASVMHCLLTAVGENWHLFDTIDFIKYSSGDTLHLPTSLLADQQMELMTSNQLPVPGVPLPDVDNGHLVSWGIVEGTQTGYIYTWAWTLAESMPPPAHNSGDEFLQALQILTNDYHIDGLIIDSRFNIGGWTYQYMQCLSLLFNEDQDLFRENIRSSTTDHYAMKEADRGILKFAATNYLFDRPIAMITGPNSVSCGDIMPMNMRKHPMVRTFGLGTNGAYGAVDKNEDFSAIYPDWILAVSHSNIVRRDQPNIFMTHLNYPPDEEIWFTQEDAVKGEDTVVKRALEWIATLSYAHNAKVDTLFAQPAIDSVFISAEVNNPNQHALQVTAKITNADGLTVDSLQLQNYGQKQDSLTGDNVWGVTWAAAEDETYFTLDISTKDPVDSTERTLPKIAHFTTVGPVQLFASDPPYRDMRFDASRNRQTIGLTFYNAGSVTTAENLKAVISTDDERVYAITRYSSPLGNIAAGATDTSGIFTFVYVPGYGPDSTINNPILFDIDIYSNDKLYWTAKIDYVTGLEKLPDYSLPVNYSLSQNYPNPFNPITTIEFQIPNSQFVTLKIYNLLGQEVTTLVSEKLKAGNYKYNWDAANFASGLYLYKLNAGDFGQTRKMLLLK
jgi:hypothetical protein